MYVGRLKFFYNQHFTLIHQIQNNYLKDTIRKMRVTDYKLAKILTSPD